MNILKILISTVLMNLLMLSNANSQTRSEMFQQHLQKKFGNEWQVFVEELNFNICKTGLKATFTLSKNTPGAETKVLMDSSNEFGYSKKKYRIRTERNVLYRWR